MSLDPVECPVVGRHSEYFPDKSGQASRGAEITRRNKIIGCIVSHKIKNLIALWNSLIVKLNLALVTMRLALCY
jgi:hypothetical protein